MLKLIPPGKRKGNRTYIIRGRFAGRDVEKVTRTRDRDSAERLKHRIERRLLESAVPGPEAAVSFSRVADLYAAAKNVSKDEERRLKRLKAVIGHKLVGTLTQADVDDAALQIHGTETPETRNRNVYTPAAAVMHYAARNHWCAWQRFDRPKMKDPETRAATDPAASALIKATTGKQKLLILWLFMHGTRISGALQIDCARIDLRARTYELYVTKTRKWETFAIDDAVWQILANDPDVERGDGLLFPWKTRWRVYDWLTPLCLKLKVKFTPHMARHWLGKKLDANGAGLKTIQKALGQASEKSASRYAVSDVETVRAATRRIGAIVGVRRRRA
jgi:integrase